MEVQWTKDGEGYEVSSAGNRRFSALYATLDDGRTIEQHYQCDVKGYDPGGTNWRLGKGKPPIREFAPASEGTLFEQYVDLWRRWANAHPKEMRQLQEILRRQKTPCLKDRFASTPINQARALAILLQEKEY